MTGDLSSIATLVNQLNTDGKIFERFLGETLKVSTNGADQELARENVLFYIYFDEAHILTEKTNVFPPPRSKYHILGNILSRMRSLRFFTVFLSTKSSLSGFAPPARRHPSVRDWNGSILHPPFTELPFDNFADNSFKHLSEANPDGVKLRHVCDLDYIVKFGRPMYVQPLLENSSLII
jgi:hypothetical protein